MMILNLIAKANFGTGLAPSSGIAKGLAAFDTDNPLTATENLVSSVIGIFTTLGALTFIVVFFMGAFKWISGGDDTSKIQKARDQMVQGIIGLIVMVAGYAIVGLVGAMIGFEILNPAEQIRDIFSIRGY